MRLNHHQIETILSVTERLAGDAVAVYLFGSRTDDRARGGDVDLLIETPQRLGLLVRAHLKIELEALLGLPVDILAQAHTQAPTPFQLIARAGAVRLEANQ